MVLRESVRAEGERTNQNDKRQPRRGCVEMARRKQKKKRKSPVMKSGCRAVEGEMERLRDLASDHGITVRVSEVQCRGRVRTMHVMFEAGKTRVLDYWPGSGTLRSPRTGETWKVADCWQALDEAARIACGLIVVDGVML